MKNWTKPAITILALAAMSHVTHAQTGGDRMAKPMGKDKTYTGCVDAGPSAGSFTLTHAMADKGMSKDGMGKDAMKKDTMGKDAMAPTTLAISSTAVDLSKHVGHKVAVTGGEPAGMAKSDAMAKPSGMDKTMSAFSVKSIKMIAATCTM